MSPLLRQAGQEQSPVADQHKADAQQHQFVGAVIVLGLVLNAINIGIERGLPVYLTAALYGAYLAGWNFIRLLLRPIWKVYRRSQPT